MFVLLLPINPHVIIDSFEGSSRLLRNLLLAASVFCCLPSRPIVSSCFSLECPSDNRFGTVSPMDGTKTKDQAF